VQKRVERNRAERAAKEDAPGPAKTSGPVATGSTYVGNAVQNAVNALFGRPMEAEQVSLLKQIAANTKPTPPKPQKAPLPGVGIGVGVFGH